MIDLIIACSDQKELAQRIAQALQVPISYAQLTRFPDGEAATELDMQIDYHNLRVALVHSMMPHPADRVLIIASLARALHDAGARDVIALVPYLAYCRQTSSRSPLALIGNLFAHAGISKVYTLQPHHADVQQYFPMPVISIDAAILIAQSIARNHAHEKFVLVAPDEGARLLVQSVADILSLPMIQCIKKRIQPDQAQIIRIEGKHVADVAIVIDDMIATGGTAYAVQQALAKHGYTTCYGYFVHPVCAGDALHAMALSGYAHMWVCNTIDHVYATSSLITSIDSSALMTAALKS